jgi:hypothetical protein
MYSNPIKYLPHAPRPWGLTVLKRLGKAGEDEI